MPDRQTMTEREMLLAYRQNPSHELFAKVISRHLDLVYSVATRQVREPQLAEDIAQEVFLALHRKIGTLNPERSLAPWLFSTTRLISLQTLRALARRRRHEHEVAMSPDASSTPDPTWSLIQDDIDAAVATLARPEREAILLRFFVGKSHQEIAAELAITEPAARKRLQRALESLAKLLTSHSGKGAAVSAAALAAALATHATATAAPPALATAISAHVLTQSALLASTSTFTWKGALMASKAKYFALACALLGVTIPVGLSALHLNALAATPPRTISPIPAGASSVDIARVYVLKPNETLVRIPGPFPDARQAWYQKLPHTATGHGGGMNYGGPGNAPSLSGQSPGGGMGGGMGRGVGGMSSGSGPLPPGIVRSGGGFSQSPTGGSSGASGNPGVPPGAQAATDAPTVPNAMILEWTDGQPLRCRDAWWSARRGYNVDGFLNALLELESGTAVSSSDQGKKFLKREIPGDFIVRAGAKPDDVRAAAEKILSDFLSVPVTLQFPDDPITAYVLRGRWKFTPLDLGDAQANRVHVFSVDRSTATGSAVGPSNMLAANLTRTLKAPVVVEAQGLPAMLSLTTHDNPAQPSDAKAVLDHITEQTGLTWTEESRKVRRLYLEPATAANTTAPANIP